MSEEMTKKPYRSCYFLESGITFQSNAIGFCCDRVSPATILPAEDAGKTIDAFFAVRGGVIRSNQSDDPPCEGCNLFREYEPTNGEIEYINFGVHNYCNFSCIYCELQGENAQNKNRPENYDALELANELKRRGLLSKDLEVICASGEMTINPKKEKYYDFIEENAHVVHFSSNAGKFDPRIADILKKSPRSTITVSIDCGTEESFRKIRGVDMFKKVAANLGEYRKYSTYVVLKYILLDENCGEEDLEGFIQLCSELKVPQLIITGDVRKSSDSWTGGKHRDYEENIVSAAIKLVQKAIDAKLYVTFMDHLGRANLREIYSRIAALPEVFSAEQQLDKTLSAQKLICYGAGGNCEHILSQLKEFGLRMPDIIWDRNAQPGQVFHTGELDIPVCRPDFDALNMGEFGVFSTIANYDTNQKLDAEMKEHGYADLLTHDRLFLALMAKQAKKPI